MRERPIVFGDHMVRALLSGTKTQVRQIIHLPHQNSLGEWQPSTIGGADGGRTASGKTVPVQGVIWHTRTGDCIASPYGQPGDRLWVRESGVASMLAGGALLSGLFRHDVPETPQTGRYWVERTRSTGASYNVAGCSRSAALLGRSAKATTAKRMPRWACRLLLEIVDVRVERLRSISEQDAVAEGIIPVPKEHPDNQNERQFWRDYRLSGDGTFCKPTAIESYKSLWESMNGEGSWDVNPWVWVIEFRIVDQTSREAQPTSTPRSSKVPLTLVS